jgi:N-acetylglucosaminyldiphosphoundecaprenol N-acetyl-beta-D-mannosaminyltransferase
MKLKSTKSTNYRTNFFQTKVLGVKINFISLPQALIEIKELVNYNKQGQITTPNPEHVVIAQDDYRMRQIINQSWLSVADGVGLVWAVRWLNCKLFSTLPNFARFFLSVVSKKDKKNTQLKHLSGVDLMIELCQLAAAKKWRVFLLGGKDNAAKLAAFKLKTKSQNSKPNLNISFFAGSSNIENETAAERAQVIRRINKFRPHLLFVAYGAPMQEKWIAANLSQLKINVAMGVGGAFDYLAGRVQRAPQWLRSAGLEWLWRLIQEPWRWKRQLRLGKFTLLVLKECLLGS